MSLKNSPDIKENDSGRVSPTTEGDLIIPPEKGDEVVIHPQPIPDDSGVVFPKFKNIIIGKPKDV